MDNYGHGYTEAGEYNPEESKTIESFSQRTQTILFNAGINSLQELSKYSVSDVLKFRNLGSKTLEEVKPYLKQFDYTIKSDNTQTLKNALAQIEKLEAEKTELLEMLELARQSVSNSVRVEIESLIQKMKP